MCNRAEDPPVWLLYLISQVVRYMTTDCKGPPASASVSVVYGTHPIALYLSDTANLALYRSDQIANPSVIPVK